MSDATSLNATSLNAKLVVSDADAAIAYYRTVFGARQTQRYTVGESVVFAEIEIFGARLTLKDEDEHDASPTTLGSPGVLMEITTDDPDALATAAVDAGGEVVFEVADQPYGARGGRVRDPFGHQWLIQTPVTMTPEQVQRAMDELRG